jgi:hypothetical protein
MLAKLDHHHLVLSAAMFAWPILDAHGTGFDLPDQDAFAGARGMAFVATADNASAIYYNPAGLTQLQSHNFRAGFYGLNLQSSFESPTGGSFDNRKALHAIPHLWRGDAAAQFWARPLLTLRFKLTMASRLWVPNDCHGRTVDLLDDQSCHCLESLQQLFLGRRTDD